MARAPRLDRRTLGNKVVLLYEACNEASEEKFRACLTENAVHYFPRGGSIAILEGATEIAAAWQRAINDWDSRWAIDRMVVDEPAQAVAVEWTHFKPGAGGYVRGAELCQFDDSGLISEIRVYYAVPTAQPSHIYELEHFDYDGRDYATEPPAVVGRRLPEAPDRSGG